MTAVSIACLIGDCGTCYDDAGDDEDGYPMSCDCECHEPAEA